jgi:tetratricopeptide (TPR) repeat protein
MKASQSNQKRFVTVTIVVMLLALLSFSIVPLISSIIATNRNVKSPVPNLRQQQLESQALGYELVLEREPDNQNAWRSLLDIRLQQGNIRGALEPLKKLAQLTNQPDYLILLAQTQIVLQDTEAALNTYRSLVETHPEDPRSLKALVDLLMTEKREQEAIEVVQESIKAATKPGSKIDLISTQLLLGEIYYLTGKLDEAMKIYQASAKLDSEDYRPILAKAIVLQEQGKHKEAGPLFETAILKAPAEFKEPIKVLANNSKTALESSKPSS